MADITVLTGFLARRRISLDTEVFSIGRHASNDLELPDLSISRQHCVIEMQSSGHGTADDGEVGRVRFVIRDLSSANGVKVNDQTVTERELQHGDRIQIGDCLLQFDEESSVTLSECVSAMESTFQLGPAEVRSMQSGEAPFAMPETERYRDDLRALLDISVTVGGLRNVSEIQSYFLNRIVPRIPADYAAAIPIVSSKLEQSVRRASQLRQVERVPLKSSPEFGVSRTVLDRVLHKQEAILAGPVQKEKFLTNAESILRSGTQAVIAAPAFSDTELVGILYLASTVAGAFDIFTIYGWPLRLLAFSAWL